MVREFLDVVCETEELPLRTDFLSNAVAGCATACSGSKVTLDAPSAGEGATLCQ